MKFPKTYAIDWDGTVVENRQFPRIGEPKPNAIHVMQRIIDEGGRIIIWTCRGGEEQAKGITEKLNEHGIYDFRLNDEFEDSKEYWKDSASPKVFADVYIDDRGIHTQGEIDWFEVEEILFPKQNAYGNLFEKYVDKSDK
jgi:hypothetical protein